MSGWEPVKQVIPPKLVELLFIIETCASLGDAPTSKNSPPPFSALLLMKSDFLIIELFAYLRYTPPP
jgi:hypothetical protein